MRYLGTMSLTLTVSLSSSLLPIMFHISIHRVTCKILQNRVWNRFSELAQLKSISDRIHSLTPPRPIQFQ